MFMRCYPDENALNAFNLNLKRIFRANNMVGSLMAAVLFVCCSLGLSSGTHCEDSYVDIY
jgi:hypothetical protein